MLRSSVFALFFTILSGCTAIRSTTHLAKAEQAHRLALEAQADVWAPYAHTRATALLQKAREEWGYSDFGPAEDLAKRASDWAAQARIQAEKADRSQPPPQTVGPGLMSSQQPTKLTEQPSSEGQQ